MSALLVICDRSILSTHIGNVSDRATRAGGISLVLPLSALIFVKKHQGTTMLELLCFIFWVVVSAFWVELMRDLWHIACHLIPILYEWFHKWHHLAYNYDFELRNEEAWRRSQWRHEIPQSLVMVFGTLLLALGAISVTQGWAVLGIGFGLFRALREFRQVILESFGLAKATDYLHQEERSESPPGQWLVNRAYHFRHHFDNPLAYFSGIYTLIDRIGGTALSLKHKRVAIANIDNALRIALVKCFEKEGATVVTILEGNLDSVDILVASDADREQISAFLQTVRRNRDIYCKEAWCIETSQYETNLPASVTRKALCTVRQVSILVAPETPAEAIAGQIFFQAKRHFTKIVVRQDFIIVFLYWLNFIVSATWLNFTQSNQQSSVRIQVGGSRGE